jgi:hypothetical protein
VTRPIIHDKNFGAFLKKEEIVEAEEEERSKKKSKSERMIFCTEHHIW